MAYTDERDTRAPDDQRRDTVVVTEGSKSPIGWIIGLIVLLLILFFLFANPFSNNDGDGTDIQVPGGDTNIEAPDGDTNIDVPDFETVQPDGQEETTPDETAPAPDQEQQ